MSPARWGDLAGGIPTPKPLVSKCSATPAQIAATPSGRGVAATLLRHPRNSTAEKPRRGFGYTLERDRAGVQRLRHLAQTTHSSRNHEPGTPSRGGSPRHFPFPKRCRRGGGFPSPLSPSQRGAGSKGGRGPGLFFSLYRVKKRGNTTSRVPLTSRDPSHFPTYHPNFAEVLLVSQFSKLL